MAYHKAFNKTISSIFILTIVCVLSVITGSDFCYADCSQIVEAKGSSPVYNGDSEMARSLAIDNARVQVVEPLGVNIDKDVSYSMGLKISDWYRIKAGGYIVHDEIIAEGEKNGGYWVKIKAGIKCGPAQDEMTRQLLNRHKILIITEGLGSRTVQSEMIPLLTQAGYQYLDSEFIKANLDTQTFGQLKKRQLHSLNKEALKFMADLVVYIRSSVEFSQKDESMGVKTDWYNGELEINLFQISGDKKGVPVILVSKSSNKLVTLSGNLNGVSELVSKGNKGPNGFKNQIAKPAVKEFMTQLSTNEVLGTSDILVELTVTGVPSIGEYHKFLSKLKSQRGVVSGSLEQISQNNQDYKVSIRYRLKSIYLANLLIVDQTYKLQDFSWNTIVLDHRNLQ